MKHFRRNIFIIPHFQLKFISFLIALSTLQVFFLWLMSHAFFQKLEKMGETANLPVGHIYYQFIHHQEAIFHLFLFGICSVFTLLMFMGSIYLSRRVAGPIYRMKTDLENMTDNENVREIKFRKGDYFQELSKSFNKFMENKKKNG